MIKNGQFWMYADTVYHQSSYVVKHVSYNVIQFAEFLLQALLGIWEFHSSIRNMHKMILGIVMDNTFILSN